jgi:dCMP deaminase
LYLPGKGNLNNHGIKKSGLVPAILLKNRNRRVMVKPDLPLKHPTQARTDWDTYFMGLACLVAGRSTCIRRQVGAIAVQDRRILATGYNGAPSGISHCLDHGCLREKLNIPSGERHELCRAVHAEQNVIIQSAVHGNTIRGATLYVHGGSPCFICARMLINAHIGKIIYSGTYPDKHALEILEEAGIEVKVFHDFVLGCPQ